MDVSVLNTPPEIWARILSGASVAFIVIDVALVCKAVRNTVLSEAFWGYWSHLHRHDAARQVQLRNEMLMYAKIQCAWCLRFGLKSIADVQSLSAKLLAVMYKNEFDCSHALSLRRYRILQALDATGQCDFSTHLNAQQWWKLVCDALHDPNHDYRLARTFLACDESFNVQMILDRTEFESIHILQLLVEEFGYSPSSNDNEMIIAACKHDAFEAVKFLLQYPIVDPAVQNQQALYNAIFHGSSKLVRFLLDDSRVCPEYVLGRILTSAKRTDQSTSFNIKLCQQATMRPHKRLRTMWYGST